MKYLIVSLVLVITLGSTFIDRTDTVASLLQVLPSPVGKSESYFINTPKSFTTNPSLFASLWSRASTEAVRIAVFGDSQETAPGGKGSIYIPYLNYQMSLRLGQVSETLVTTCGGFGSGIPWGAWLHTGHTASPGSSVSRVDPTYMLPGLCSLSHSTKNSGTNVNGQAYGQLYILRQNAERIDPESLIPTDTSYFCGLSSVKAQIIATTNPSSGELRILHKPTNNALSGNFFEPIALNHQMTLGLESGVFAVKSGLTPSLSIGAYTYHQIEINGDTDAKLTNLIGARFISDTCSQGVVFQPLSVGGYQVSHHLNNHSNAGEMFKHLEFDAAMIHLGANDSSNSVSADTHKAQMLQLIAQIRTWQEDPTFPIFIMGDIYHKNMTTQQSIDFDLYPFMYYQIALQDPYVKFINSRLLAHNDGMSAGNLAISDSWLSDSVHYSSYGARRLAELEVAEMMN